MNENRFEKHAAPSESFYWAGRGWFTGPGCARPILISPQIIRKQEKGKSMITAQESMKETHDFGNICLCCLQESPWWCECFEFFFGGGKKTLFFFFFSRRKCASPLPRIIKNGTLTPGEVCFGWMKQCLLWLAAVEAGSKGSQYTEKTVKQLP